MEKTNLIFSIINTALIVTGGILGYFLVTTHQVDETKSNISLAKSEIAVNQAELGLLVSEKVLKDIKAELAPLDEALALAKTNGEVILNLSQTTLNDSIQKLNELEIEIKKANLKIESLSKKANVTLDISSLINDIQPALEIGCTGTSPPQMEIDCKFENLGDHKVMVEAPNIEIYMLNDNSIVDEKLYSVKGLIGNTIVSNGTGNNKIYITDLTNNLKTDFVIKINWKVCLHPSIKKAVLPLLNEVIDPKLIDGLTEIGYTYRLTYSATP